MRIELPDPSLVVLIGASGSGKSSFAREHFSATEVLSSDAFRGMVADDENDQAATSDAFEALYAVAGIRLRQPRLTVVDATNVQRESRRGLVQLAKAHDLFCVAIVLDMPEALCHERNRTRGNRAFGPHVVKKQRAQLHKSLKGLRKEGFRHTWVLGGPEDVAAVAINRTPLWTDRRAELGPFDVIGDVHGCHAELVALLTELGWNVAADGLAAFPPHGRRAVFVGDYVDRGPASPQVLELVMRLAADGHALCLPGNHDAKLVRSLGGRDVQLTHGLAETMEQLEGEPSASRERIAAFLDGLVSHLVLDGGALVVAHAGLRESYHGRSSGRVREFALYGDTTGETDVDGLPVRRDWAREYRGAPAVVYGHTPVAEPEWVNRTLNIDTGCVFGGRLTALRWPERELVSVPAQREHYAPARPFLPEPDALPEDRGKLLLDVTDVAGKRIVETRLSRTVTIFEEQSAAALETMSRFAVDPRWLVHLPPTMAPTATSQRPEYLEHPEQALAEYRAAGVAHVVCEEKHMGSRAIAVLCRDADTASTRFGVADGTAGVVVTRTGRPFFDDQTLHDAVVDRARAAVETAGLWELVESDWVVLDCELMPWSAKAVELLKRQYAAVGAAGAAGLAASRSVLAQTAARGVDVAELADHMAARADHVDRYRAAYRRYAWPVAGLDDLRLAPFHVLAAESGVFVERPRPWHLDRCDALVAADPGWMKRTDRLVVELDDPAAEAEAVAWWTALTVDGGEGMVVKPLDFVAHGRKGLVQPGIKCRGQEYLRIVYGPEYLDPTQIERLRARSLGRKRSLALREFALGVEALERFVRHEPLHRVHECVFGVLALESEPVDPRL